jgi:hypothetical protein
MQQTEQAASQANAISPNSPPSWWQRNGPAVTLLLLAPVISEVLYGSTRVSVIPVLIPEIMCWGCGALLIRHFVRRWQKGWLSMMLMGLALAVAEECVIQQTSIAPLVGLAPHAYGRVFGVNWVYFLWALGYECAWVVLIPVQLTELLFPARRREEWLGTRGVFVVGGFFVLGSFLAWYSWTQMSRVQVFHMEPYSPPPLYIAAGLAGILTLIFASYRLYAPAVKRETRRPAPTPVTVALMAGILGTPWAAAVEVGFGNWPLIPYWWALAVGSAWAGLTLILIKRWTSCANWGDAHRYALVFGGVIACMLGGFGMYRMGGVGGVLTVDWIGKGVLNLAAAGWLVWFGVKRMRSTEG